MGFNILQWNFDKKSCEYLTLGLGLEFFLDLQFGHCTNYVVFK